MAPEPSASQPSQRKRRSRSTPLEAADDVFVLGNAGTQAQTQTQTQTQAGPSNAQADTIPYDPEEATRMRNLIKKYEESAAKAQEENPNIGLNAAELEALVARVVRHMVFKNHEKQQVPVPRKDLIDLINENYKDHRSINKIRSFVMVLAQAKMIKTFGLEMVELERVSDGKKDSGAKSYVLRSALPAGLRSVLVDNSSRKPSMMFLVLVLALIMMNGDKMESGELWRHLGQLSVQQDSPHPTFGDPKAELHKMEQRRYIVARRSESRNPETGQHEIEYRWGEAAEGEFSKSSVKAQVEKWMKEMEAGGAAARMQDMMEVDEDDL